MKGVNGIFASRSVESAAISHRLSWFTTLQGLLFLSFMLVDKSHVTLISLMICAGVALCLPAIAGAYRDAGIQSWLKLLLAIFWVMLGGAMLIFRAP